MHLPLLQLVVLRVELSDLCFKISLLLARWHRLMVYLHQDQIAMCLLHYLFNVADLSLVRLRGCFHLVLDGAGMGEETDDI